MMACFDSVSAQPFDRALEKSPYMRRTLASPIFAISSNSPSAIFAEALSASMRTARRGERGSEGMTFPKMDGDETCQDWDTEATFFDWRKRYSEADTISRISQPPRSDPSSLRSAGIGDVPCDCAPRVRLSPVYPPLALLLPWGALPNQP